MAKQFNRFPVSHDGGKRDERYEISREFCGYAQAQYVLRFCGEFIISSPFYSSVVVRAVGHNAMRRGARPIVEIQV